MLPVSRCRRPVLDRVRSVPGVSHAAGMVEGHAEVVDPDGDASGNPTMATIGGSADGIGTVSPFELRSGRVPAGADEVAVDASTARTYGLAVGDRVTVVFAGPARQFTVVGTVGMGRIDDVANTTYALFDLPTAQAVLGRPGQVDEVLVSVTPGTSPDELVRRISSVVGPGAVVETTADRAAERSADAADDLATVDIALNDLRVDRAGRGRVHHRQHVHHRGGPAHA